MLCFITTKLEGRGAIVWLEELFMVFAPRKGFWPVQEKMEMWRTACRCGFRAVRHLAEKICTGGSAITHEESNGI